MTHQIETDTRAEINSRLAQSATGARMRTSKTGRDLTDDMTGRAQWRGKGLRSWSLRRHTFKRDSPTCGTEHAKVCNEHNIPELSGDELHAQSPLATHPNMSVEEDGRLYLEPHPKALRLRNRI